MLRVGTCPRVTTVEERQHCFGRATRRVLGLTLAMTRAHHHGKDTPASLADQLSQLKIPLDEFVTLAEDVLRPQPMISFDEFVKVAEDALGFPEIKKLEVAREAAKAAEAALEKLSLPLKTAFDRKEEATKNWRRLCTRKRAADKAVENARAKVAELAFSDEISHVDNVVIEAKKAVEDAAKKADDAKNALEKAASNAESLIRSYDTGKVGMDVCEAANSAKAVLVDAREAKTAADLALAAATKNSVACLAWAEIRKLEIAVEAAAVDDAIFAAKAAETAVSDAHVLMEKESTTHTELWDKWILALRKETETKRVLKSTEKGLEKARRKFKRDVEWFERSEWRASNLDKDADSLFPMIDKDLDNWRTLFAHALYWKVPVQVSKFVGEKMWLEKNKDTSESPSTVASSSLSLSLSEPSTAKRPRRGQPPQSEAVEWPAVDHFTFEDCLTLADILILELLAPGHLRRVGYKFIDGQLEEYLCNLVSELYFVKAESSLAKLKKDRKKNKTLEECLRCLTRAWLWRGNRECDLIRVQCNENYQAFRNALRKVRTAVDGFNRAKKDWTEWKVSMLRLTMGEDFKAHLMRYLQDYHACRVLYIVEELKENNPQERDSQLQKEQLKTLKTSLEVIGRISTDTNIKEKANKFVRQGLSDSQGQSPATLATRKVKTVKGDTLEADVEKCPYTIETITQHWARREKKIKGYVKKKDMTTSHI